MPTLDYLIDPEINKTTSSYHMIKDFVSKVDELDTILEIGGGGGGTTEAIIQGILEAKKDEKINFATIELSKSRSKKLEEKFGNHSFYKIYNTSSITIDKLPSEQEIEKFIKKTGVHNGDIDKVLGWLRQDIEYSKSSGLNENGIDKVKKDFKRDKFSLVILDSGEFSSNAEYSQLKDCDAYFLDDIFAYKNWYVHRELLNNLDYTMIFKVCERGGSSLFCKNHIAKKYFNL